MSWTTPVNVSDVRTEYPLLTADLCADARVTANRDRAEAEIEAVLRDRYELTDPGADKYVWRICLALTAVPLHQLRLRRARLDRRGADGGLDVLARVGSVQRRRPSQSA